MFLGREIRKPGVFGKVFKMLDRPAMEKAAREKLTELGLMTIRLFSRRAALLGIATLASTLVIVLVCCAMLHLALIDQQVFGGHLAGGVLGEVLGEVEHIFTHRKLRLVVHEITEVRGEPQARGYPEVRWVSSETVTRLPLSRLTQKVLAAVGWRHE